MKNIFLLIFILFFCLPNSTMASARRDVFSSAAFHGISQLPLPESSMREEDKQILSHQAPFESGAEERLIQAINQLKKIQASELPPLPLRHDLKPGNKDSRVPLLRKHLLLSGDLKEENSHDSEEFDDDLVKALVRFQRRFGLYDNGVLGPESLAALNMPIAKQICKAQENLNRLRSLSSDLHGRYLLVNIPGYRLQLVENSKVIMTMRVVLGRIDRPSPELNSTMNYLVFSPEWHVPRTIAINDKLPLLKKDPHYLEKQGMKLYDDNQAQMVEVDPLTINWQDVNAENFPYRIIQDPSDLNSLGHVKFMFPNNDSVYLHDTPDKEFFKYTVRAFSSGCFRLEKPIELAEYLLRDQPNWNRAAIIEAMAKGIQKEVGLKKPIPIHIVYLTAWANDEGQLQFRTDIYKKDSCQ
jgi:murein L,D-transpeptidase YcbB/YkuD